MTADLVALIRRRHEGPGWQVFTELANGTGGRAKRRADALAMAMWPSLGYEVHGYEIKISRGDVRRELQDVAKSDAVGKYCDFWWLVISDPTIIDGLIVPAGWGILTPRDRVLRVVRPAKKRKALALDRTFVAAMIRSAISHWVPRETHNAEIKRAVENERAHGGDETKRDLERLRRMVADFEATSGITISGWRHAATVGKAVEILLQIMNSADTSGIKRRADDLQRVAVQYDELAAQARNDALALREPTGGADHASGASHTYPERKRE